MEIATQERIGGFEHIKSEMFRSETGVFANSPAISIAEKTGVYSPNEIKAAIFRMLPCAVSLLKFVVPAAPGAIDACVSRLERIGLVSVRKCAVTGKDIVVDRRSRPSPKAAEPVAQVKRGPRKGEARRRG